MREPILITAFHDIGRGDWDKTAYGVPITNTYLKRDTDTYIRRFERMCKLKNRIIAFVDSDLIHRLPVQDNVDYYPIEPILNFHANQTALSIIKEIHESEEWIELFGKQVNPERWCSEYNWINFLKPQFILEAIDRGYIEDNDDNLYAWIDFGYFRKNPKVETILMDFSDSDKQLIFQSNQCHPEDIKESSLIKTIYTGSVQIQGCFFVGTKLGFRLLNIDMWATFNSVSIMGLTDDDQTFLSMFYKKMNEFVELRKNSGTNWFIWAEDN